MVINSLKSLRFILVSGILNCLLAIIHYIVLYFTYSEYAVLETPETVQVIADALLFSIAVGNTLLFIGLLTCYCYTGIKRRDKWAVEIGSGASVLLCTFAFTIIAVAGFNQPIAYVHLSNSLMIGIPLVINRSSLKIPNQNR